MNQLRRDCTFCDEKNVNYSCPKCGQYYCSINCYNNKKHLNCSEQFFKKNVEDELRLQSKELDQNLKRNTLEILKRDYDNLINENVYDLDELKDKFNQLNVQNIDDLWNYLDDNEKQKFNDLLKQNQIINLLPVNCWTPWYLKIKEKSNLIEELNTELNNGKESTNNELNNNKEPNNELINEVSNKDKLNIEVSNNKLNDKQSNNSIKKNARFKEETKLNNDLDNEFNDKFNDYELSKDKFIKEIESNLNESNSKIASLNMEIKKLIDLTKIKPSLNVKCTFLNLILSYCYMCRYFNNDHHTFVNESFNLINEISLLNQKTIFKSTRQSIQYTIQLLINHKHLKIDFILILIDDLKFIIENNQKIYLNIIADLINLFKEYKKLLKKQKLKNNYKINKNNLINQNQLKIKDQLEGNLSTDNESEDKKSNNESNDNQLKDNLPIKSESKIDNEPKDKRINNKLNDNKIDLKLKDVNLLLKKLDYYLSYSNEYRDELLNELSEIEIERMYLSNFKKSIDENDEKNKKFIDFI